MLDKAPETGAFAAPTDARPAQALIHSIERLEAIVRAETNLLRQGGDLDFQTLNARKTHALVEFIQASKAVDASRDDDLAESVQRLRELLVANAEILDRLLQATQEIAMLTIASIRRDESDGTYSPRRPGGR
ncbi:hypothetical protein ACNHKD_16720 [Methylocystis sp. JAN1]|uniref:hypothetical protein n=1 Tax=Methylocystis sp. JAN1 TaxID=3397211 RepID=UPI003FA2BB2E